MPSQLGGRIQGNIHHLAAVRANKMPVLVQVWTVAGGLAVNVDLAHQATLDQRFQAVVNRGQRNRRHAFFGAKEDFGSGRVVAFCEQHIENFSSLRGQTQPATTDGLLVAFDGIFLGLHGREFSTSFLFIKNKSKKIGIPI